MEFDSYIREVDKEYKNLSKRLTTRNLDVAIPIPQDMAISWPPVLSIENGILEANIYAVGHRPDEHVVKIVQVAEEKKKPNKPKSLFSSPTSPQSQSQTSSSQAHPVVSPVSTGQSQPLDAPTQTFTLTHAQSQPVVAPVSTGADYGRGNTNKRKGSKSKWSLGKWFGK